MAYTVLARKYRSQRFDEVIGQDPIARTLKNAIKTARVAHAYLFTGTRGVGKTTMARVLAKSLNCLSVDAPTTEPCCKCQSCTAVNLGEDIDVIEIDGATHNGVEQVRELRQNAIYRPARARFKIYIIDEVHMLSVPAFNALLKTLEEPPSHVKFIFATTEPNKVIATIQSRCQRFDFSNITPTAIARQLESILKAEKIKYEDDLVLPLAKMANGSMRDALSLLDRLISTGADPLSGSLLEEFLGCANSEKVWNLIDKIAESDAAGTLAAIEDLIGTGTSEVQTIDSLVDYMRDLMVVKSAGADSELLILTAEQRKRAGELAEKFDIAALVYNIATLEKLRWSIKNTDTARALLEASLLRFALSEHFMNIDTLLSQLKGNSATGVKKKQSASLRPKPTTSPQAAIPKPPAKIDEPQLPIHDSQPTSHEPQATSHESRAASSESQTPLHASRLTVHDSNDIQSIKAAWQNILELVAAKLGGGTAGLLSSAVPSRFDNGLLTLEFPPSAQMQKQMCESNGRTEQIQSLLAEKLSAPVTLSFELAETPTQTKAEVKQKRPPAQKRNELINDPAVKTVLLGLDATITGIEED
ncbi:MAG: DNA polymerase III subunit gamma/tau [Planctomycetes bacterium]|nr:DNA polymerase III subunit gamma/tau [Planctomycetota bacterium]